MPVGERGQEWSVSSPLGHDPSYLTTRGWCARVPPTGPAAASGLSAGSTCSTWRIFTNPGRS